MCVPLGERYDVSQLSVEQEISGRTLLTGSVLRELSGMFRNAIGIELLKDDEPVTAAETKLIFTFCYFFHKGPSTKGIARATYSMADLHHYLAKGSEQGKMPYYVIRTYDHGPDTSQLTPEMREAYLAACRLDDHEVPELYGPHSNSLMQSYVLTPEEI